MKVYDAIFRVAQWLAFPSEDSSWGRRSDSMIRPIRRMMSYHRQAIIRPFNISREHLFQAIANQDHRIFPSVRGRIPIFDPCSGIVLLRDDDRGLDVIATTASPLPALRTQFGPWVNQDKVSTLQASSTE